MGPVPQRRGLRRRSGGQPPGPSRLGGRGAYAAERLTPEDDIHATAEYRRHLAGVLTARSLKAAQERAVVIP